MHSEACHFPALLALLAFLALPAEAAATDYTGNSILWGEDERPLAPVKKLTKIALPPLQETEQGTSGAEEETKEKPSQASPLEDMYSSRVVDSLTQFGYDLFAAEKKRTDRDTFSVPSGAVQNDFILNIGDEISVTLRGQKNMQTTARVDSQGQIVIDTFAPIPAAGRTLEDVQDELREEAAQLYNTEVFLSLNKVNQVNVLVVGHVARPGRQTLTGFDTVMDALMEAGGIQKTGTLRQIRLIRDGRTTIVDLYGLLIYGSDNSDLTLRNGDKIMVKPIGPTVAIAGGVKRAGIYEILPALQANWSDPSRSQALAMNDLLDMAGGVLSTAQNRFIRMGVSTSGQENIQTVQDPLQRMFSDGDILMVERGEERRAGTVELIGNASAVGLHALNETTSLSSLLAREGTLKRDTYPLIGVIERWNKSDMTRQLIGFPPLLVLSGQYDRKLVDGDIVRLFSQADMKRIQKDAPMPNESSGSSDNELLDFDPLIDEFLKERCVFLRGAVRQPGSYPVSAGATLQSLLAIAGGTSIEANTKNIEISRAVPTDGNTRTIPLPERRLTVNLASMDASTIALGAGDTVRINQKYKRVEDTHALIVGEVSNPGAYDIMPGDTLGSLLARAGGLNDQAYPEGAIFSRVSERKREEGRFKAQARDLELRLATMIETADPDKKPSEREISAGRDLIAQLRQAEAVGRITIEARPDVLQKHPEQDILLESGDRIFIPKRPMTVRVAGEVLSPAALQYQARQGSSDYVSKAGGYTYNADKGRTFIVFPDGSARPAGSWGRGTNGIPPGSTIVVPRDPKPFDFMDTAKDLTQILANLATTVIFSAALEDN